MLSRRLDSVENTFITPVSYLCDLAEYEGALDEAALCSAYSILCARHPILGGEIRERSGIHELHVPSDRRTQVKVLDGDKAALREELESLRACARVAAQLLVIRGKGRGYVGLCVHHAFFDFAAFAAIFNELWHLYAKIVNRSRIEICCDPVLPRSPQELLEERWCSDSSGVARTLPGVRGRRGSGPFLQREISFSQVETMQIIATAYQNSTSVHGLVCGAILVALRSEGTEQMGNAPMLCHSAVDLRSRVEPQVEKTETTVFQGMHRAEVRVSMDSNFVVLGSAVKKQLDAGIGQRSVAMLHQLANFKIETPLEKRFEQTVVSNCGVLPTVARSPGLKVKDRLIEVFLGSETSTMCPTHMVFSYDQRLRIICGYPSRYHTHEDAERIGGRIYGLLRKCNNVRNA